MATTAGARPEDRSRSQAGARSGTAKARGTAVDPAEPRWLNQEELAAWLANSAIMTSLSAALDARMQRESRLTFFEYSVLSVLSEEEDRTMRMSALAVRTSASLSRLSHVVGRLEKRGLLARTRVSGPGRRTDTTLTRAGHDVVVAAAPGHVAAVATRREESARKAAELFGAERWYADPYELIDDPSIDLVTVAVKVPAHRELVLAALAAGKAVYSESPLGASVAETEEMAAAAGSLHTAIGLQGSLTPSVRRAAEIIAEGRLGRLLSARVTATTFGNGPESVSAYEYFDKRAAGASFMTIAVGHVLDVVETILGDVTEIDARTELFWPEVKLVDAGTTTAREVPDHLDAIVKTASGAPVEQAARTGVRQ